MRRELPHSVREKFCWSWCLTCKSSMSQTWQAKFPSHVRRGRVCCLCFQLPLQSRLIYNVLQAIFTLRSFYIVSLNSTMLKWHPCVVSHEQSPIGNYTAKSVFGWFLGPIFGTDVEVVEVSFPLAISRLNPEGYMDWPWLWSQAWIQGRSLQCSTCVAKPSHFQVDQL